MQFFRKLIEYWARDLEEQARPDTRDGVVSDWSGRSLLFGFGTPLIDLGDGNTTLIATADWILQSTPHFSAEYDLKPASLDSGQSSRWRPFGRS